MPKLILNPLSAKLDYVSTKADLDLSGTNSGDVTVTDTSTIDFTLTGQALTGSVIQSGITHNNLGGLTTGDPHTQYALLLGRSGGQTLIGGTAANDDLTLEGTSNATRTTSYVILQPNGGNVGIGTTSPDKKLDIRDGDFRLSKTADALYNFDINWNYDGSNSLNLIAAGTTFLEYDTNNGFTSFRAGNVGIGTTSPALAKLEIWGTKILPDSYNYGMLNIHDTTASAAGVGGAISFSGYMDAIPNQVMGGSINLYKVNSTSGHSGFGLKFYTKTNNLNPSARVTIDDIGNVGIGTTSPETLLTVSGSGYFTTDFRNSHSSGASIYCTSTAPGGLQWQLVATADGNGFGGGKFFIAKGDGTSSYLTIVQSSGNVGINDTAPSAQLHVDQTSTTAAKPTLRLQQADLSEEFIRFDATVGTGNPINTTALGTYYGRVRVYVEGVGEKWLALYNT